MSGWGRGLAAGAGYVNNSVGLKRLKQIIKECLKYGKNYDAYFYRVVVRRSFYIYLMGMELLRVAHIDRSPCSKCRRGWPPGGFVV